MIKKNKHIGSNFNDFLQEEGILEEPQTANKEIKQTIKGAGLLVLVIIVVHAVSKIIPMIILHYLGR